MVNGPSVACGARSVATALALLFSVEGNMVLFVGKGVVVVVVCSANVKKKKFLPLAIYTFTLCLLVSKNASPISQWTFSRHLHVCNVAILDHQILPRC